MMQARRIDWPAIAVMLFVLTALVQRLLMPPVSIPSVDTLLLPIAGFVILLEFKNDLWFRRGILIFGGIVLTTILSNTMNNGITLNEMLWSIRWVKLFALLWSGLYLARYFPGYFKWFVESLFLLIVLVNAFQLMQVSAVIDLYAPNEVLAEYAKRTVFESRLFGTMQNPNNNAMIMALFALYFAFVQNKWKYAYMALALVILLMTQSRTVILATSVIIPLTFFFRNYKLSARRLIFIITGALAAVTVVWLLDLHYVSSIFDGTAFQSSSLSNRFEALNRVIELNKENWLFGQGKVVSIPGLIGHSIDNELGYIYLEKGALGIFAFVGLLTYTILLKKSKGFFIEGIAFVGIMLICGLTNLAFTNPESGCLFFVLFLAVGEKLPGREYQ